MTVADGARAKQQSKRQCGSLQPGSLYPSPCVEFLRDQVKDSDPAWANQRIVPPTGASIGQGPQS